MYVYIYVVFKCIYFTICIFVYLYFCIYLLIFLYILIRTITYLYVYEYLYVYIHFFHSSLNHFWRCDYFRINVCLNIYINTYTWIQGRRLLLNTSLQQIPNQSQRSSVWPTPCFMKPTKLLIVLLFSIRYFYIYFQRYICK